MAASEIENPTETEEIVENPVAVLRKNRELLADLARMKDRTSALEEAARALGVADDDLADPRAFVAKRAEERKVADTRARTIREAALTTIAAEQRIVHGDLEATLAKVLGDARVTVAPDGKVSGLAEALERLAPKRAAPVPPPPGGVMNWRDSIHHKSTVTDFAELQAQGPAAVARFAESNPDQYAALREDWQRRLAKPERRG